MIHWKIRALFSVYLRLNGSPVVRSGLDETS